MARYATARSAIEKYWRPDIALFVGAMLVGAFILYVNYLTLSEMREDTVRSVEANLKGQAVLLAGEGDRSENPRRRVDEHCR